MTVHVPVLADRIVELLDVKPGQIVVDGTLGGGGHTRLLAVAVSPQGQVIALDRDLSAVERAKQELSGLPVQLVHANYSDIPEILDSLQIESVDAILLDLGLSSDQLADQTRGFSYESEGPLDLRFDTSRGQPAWKLMDRMGERHLADLIYKWGEERKSRRVARAIVEAREKRRPVRTAKELAELVRRVVPRSRGHDIDPATRTFQALRIAVNEELKWAEVALQRLPSRLNPGGRIGVISFHSLEDRIVKNAFRDNEQLEILTKKPIRPDESEVQSNSRSRSARMRVARRKD